MSKAAIERAIASSGLPSLARLRRRRSVLILAYHNVVPAGVAIGGDSSLHLPAQAFAAQLDALQQTHEVIPLEWALNGNGTPSHRPRVVITFDDAYRGAVTLGIPEVVNRKLPATIFVAPAFVGGRFFWWDALAQAGSFGPPDSVRRHALEECRGDDTAVRRWAESCGYQAQLLPDAAACASAEELRTAAAQPGITVASHSWNHRNLSRLASSELEEELERPLVWLRQRFRNLLPAISYPYGLSSPAVERAAAAAGYRMGFLVSGGWLPRQPRNPLALPRLNIPAGVSRLGFLLRTAGLVSR